MCRGTLNRVLRCAVIYLATCLAALSSSNAQTGKTSEAANPQAIETIVRRELALRNLPGAALAITRGGKVVHVSGYGRDSDGRPLTQDTPFYIASASKAMTAVAVMQLVEAGRIELDARVRRYLPRIHLGRSQGGADHHSSAAEPHLRDVGGRISAVVVAATDLTSVSGSAVETRAACR